MFKPLFTKLTVAEKDMEATASALPGVTVLEQLLNVFSYTCHPCGDQDTLHPVKQTLSKPGLPGLYLYQHQFCCLLRR